MTIIKRFSLALALTFFFLLVNVRAQTPQLSGVNLTPEEGRVRASSVGEVFDLRLEVIDEAGDTVFAAAQPEAGKPLDWDMTDSKSRKVPPGTYTVTVSYTTQAGKARKRIEQVLVTEEVMGGGVVAAAGAQKSPQPSEASPSPSAPVGGQAALVDGGGAVNRVPKFTDSDTLTSSSIMEVGTNVSIGKLAAPAAGLRLEVNGATRLNTGGSGGFMQFGTPNTETGLTWQKGTTSRADIRFNGARLTLAAGTGAGVPANSGVVINTSGNVGIGTVADPAAGLRLEVNGATRITPGGSGGFMQFGNPNTETGITWSRTASPAARADIRFNGTTLTLAAVAGAAVPPNINGIGIDTSGNVTIGVLQPSHKLTIGVGSNSVIGGIRVQVVGGQGILATSEYTTGVHGIGQTGVVGQGGPEGVLGSGTVIGVTGYSATGTGIVARSSSGFLVEGIPSKTGGTRTFHIDLDGTYVAGSDFAESLPTHGNKSNYEPGDVLIMSTQSAGVVEKSSRPYDTRVAGVYSTRPGVLGADKDGATRVDPGDVPVAIVGIVPTKVSAENGAIRVGDLLTTSRTPGYAMRCAKRVRCIGAIVGKAIEPLKKGRGLVKVLVTLR